MSTYTNDRVGATSTKNKTPRVGTKARPMYFQPSRDFTKAEIVQWQEDLRAAGFPEWLQPRAIGRDKMAEIAHLRTENPRLHGVMVEAHLVGTVEFLVRLPDGGRSYLERLVQEDPELYGPLKA